MKRKHQEFMDLKKGRRSMHNNSKFFNHLAQYALEQVGTDEKKKYRFMNKLSTKLQECLALNTSGTFLEILSNAIIMDDAIHAHKEGKKWKVVAAPSGSAPSKYRLVYPPHPTYQPRQHQHHQQQQWWASRPHSRPHKQLASKALPPPLPVLCLPAPSTTGAASSNTCFNCGCTDHFS
jgi:hypothetical protein